MLNAAEKNVHLKFEGDVSIRRHEQRQKIYQAKRAWHLYLNNEQIGMARYEPSIKNALKFEHTLWIDIQEISYKFLFYKGSSQVLLYKEDRKIGEGDITKLYKGHFYISIDDEQELILATAFVLLHYMHN